MRGATREYWIAREFSEFPAGRHRSDGPHSGEELRTDLARLITGSLATGRRLVVVLDDTLSLPSAFLEETFGGLVRVCGFTPEQLGRALEIKAIKPLYEPYKMLAERFIAEAERCNRIQT